MTIFATLNPIDPGTNTRVTVRLCASQDEASTGADGQIWWPAIATLPVIRASFFDGDFSSPVDAPSTSFDVRLDVLIASGLFPRVERYDWADAECRLQRLSAGLLVDVAVMRVDSFASQDMVLGLRLAAARELFDADVLRSTYAGTGGAEGGADLRGRFKPWAFGRCANVEPVFINQIDNVFQVSGYGAVQAISAVYERGASFGASVGDFASYAALVAANIPEGRWGTCLAQGMFRLGAPPAGVITCDVDGDNVGGFLRRTGAILSNIATRIGLVDKVNSASMSALDTAVPRNVNIVIRDQIGFMELAQRMLAPCNAVGSVGASGRLIASRVTFGAEQFTLDAQGREMPPVLGMARQHTSPPYKRILMGAARSWRVHTFDEIAFFAELIDRGLYNATEVYREGNIVESADKSRWVYVNPTASSGNAPPTWPTTSNAFWSNIAPPIGGDLIGSIVAPANANRVPLSRMEGDSGWLIQTNPSGLAITQQFAAFEGMRFYKLAITATASNQVVSIGSFPSGGVNFRVTGGERLSVQSRVEFVGAGAAGGTWSLTLWVILANGSQVSGGSVSGSDQRSIGAGFVSFFATMPANAVGARLELYGFSGGAGNFDLVISEPMVTSAAVGQTVHPPYSPGPNARDGADPNSDITVDGGGVLSGIGTAGIVVDNTRVPLGSNAVVNSEFTRGKFGWRWQGGLFENEWGVNLPGWFGQRNVMWARVPGVWANGNVRDLSPDALWSGADASRAPQFAMPVIAGDRIAATVLMAEHRCTGQLWILIFDGAGTLIGTSNASGGTELGAANGDPANFTRLTTFADAPANARWAIPMMRLLGTGENDPYIFFTEPMLSKVAAGQTVAPRYSPGRADSLADETATAQRSIEPQFPSIEIKQGEAGHTGNRTVTHTAKRGTTTLTGGTWSIVSTNLGTGVPAPSATINSGNGTVTLSNIIQSGAYIVRYTHTDGIQTDFPVNVTYVPTPPTAVQQAKTGRVQSSTGTFNNNNWQTILTLTIPNCPAGRVNFEGDSLLDPLTGSGTADFEARLRLDNTTTIASVASQAVVDAGNIVATSFFELFGTRADVTAGTRTFTIELRRTSGAGVINSTNTSLEATIIAT